MAREREVIFRTLLAKERAENQMAHTEQYRREFV